MIFELKYVRFIPLVFHLSDSSFRLLMYNRITVVMRIYRRLEREPCSLVSPFIAS